MSTGPSGLLFVRSCLTHLKLPFMGFIPLRKGLFAKSGYDHARNRTSGYRQIEVVAYHPGFLPAGQWEQRMKVLGAVKPFGES